MNKQRRLVLVTSDKGGTGKSTFSRAYLDCLSNKSLPYTAFDGDTRNPQLYRHYQSIASGVQQITISEDEGIDTLIDALVETDQPLVIIDLPAGGGAALEKLEAEAGIFYALKATGFKLSIVSVLTPVKDCVVALQLLLDRYQDNVDYVAVRNEFFGDASKFINFENSPTHQQFLQLGGQEIIMPSLYPSVHRMLDEHSLSFQEALEDNSPLSFSQKMRLQKWMELKDRELEKVAPVIGIEKQIIQYEFRGAGFAS
ncbi:MAG TPA: hypothetical protein V6D15_13115 [Oculatellaceae cyanobacterium]